MAYERLDLIKLFQARLSTIVDDAGKSPVKEISVRDDRTTGGLERRPDRFKLSSRAIGGD